MPRTITVEIWSDIMCPFCYIGKKHFERALQDFGHKKHVNVTWKSFQLNPGLISDPSKNSLEYLAEAKGWTLEHTRQAAAHVTEMANKASLNFHLDKAIVANTMDAHRLIHLAKQKEKDNEAEEELFHAYFTEGKNIADHSVLLDISKKIGLNEDLTREILNTETFKNNVMDDQVEANHLGVRGVPFFVFNRKFAVSGAQPPETFLQTLEKAILPD